MTAKTIEDPACRDRVFVFRDRLHAGKLLPEKLREYADKGNVILLASPVGIGLS
jgi:predicted phosphoribosyltransferase